MRTCVFDVGLRIMGKVGRQEMNWEEHCARMNIYLFSPEMLLNKTLLHLVIVYKNLSVSLHTRST